ncbi:hypothetical protein SAMN06265365_103128 [Tistlia consotensis]|uniref:UPF0276 protein SAMN05428998_10699 n=1 Tax=Tistlia consotensis USBA 355 TaxID=560819 RepID=A0A1Y6BLI5_9PROT|nr:DUF692 domain-containing protein [Tistlia consotensis]SMF17394.1 hypothetical protein SAMN05428998_10699 [Tistlia consotensis USBA 355]SNR40462.1 hypothetical protein SAMN06265365_103128 [Tistlia consotensis]
MSASRTTVAAGAPAAPRSAPLPERAGVGLRHRHVPDFLTGRPAAAWLEVHSENYLVEGGPRTAQLERIRADYPLSCHGVGLSLGSAEGLDAGHLARLRALYDRFEPGLVSDHLSWSVAAGTYAADLLPLPMTEEALAVVARNLDHAQAALGRRLAVENPSCYLSFAASTIPEAEFLAELVRRTGCALLLDVNNLYVCQRNLGLDPAAWLDAVPGEAVAEIHLAGHARIEVEGRELLIDDHGSRVIEPVWQLYQETLRRFGPRPTLIEWDTALPPLEVLLGEAERAQEFLDACDIGLPAVARGTAREALHAG